MKVTILGCGPSYGMPSLTRGFGPSDPNEPKNVRTRSDILIEDKGVGILIDTGPEIREQLLRAGTPKIHAILYTHAHYDHMGGAQDLRNVAIEKNEVLDIYGTPKDMLALRRQMPYVFEPSHQKTLSLHYIKPYKSFKIKHLEIIPIFQHHGESSSIGYRIGDFAYCTDVKKIDPEGWKLLKGVKTWVLGCVTTRVNAKHVHLPEALKWVKKLKPERTYLTHMGSKMDYKELKKTLPKGVEPCYDGMVIKI
ncbi:MAG: MBL fold metallo-hydrolase [Alphaproteobacteria bacterium]|nr:MBL fold metallo-hydrolase [Alphaproteobacteria bacterium]